MLDALRGQKAKKFTAWILVMLVGVPFIFYYGWNTTAGGGGGGQMTVAAEVNGQPIYAYEIPTLRRELAFRFLGELAQMLGTDQLEQRLHDDLVLDEAI